MCSRVRCAQCNAHDAECTVRRAHDVLRTVFRVQACAHAHGAACACAGRRRCAVCTMGCGSAVCGWHVQSRILLMLQLALSWGMVCGMTVE